jgi:hypothetical protein
MVVINQYSQNDWLAMKMLKSSLAYMKTNNDDGVYDIALTKQRSVLRHFMRHEDYRTELPDAEDAVAVAA